MQPVPSDHVAAPHPSLSSSSSSPLFPTAPTLPAAAAEAADIPENGGSGGDGNASAGSVRCTASPPAMAVSPSPMAPSLFIFLDSCILASFLKMDNNSCFSCSFRDSAANRIDTCTGKSGGDGGGEEEEGGSGRSEGEEEGGGGGGTAGDSVFFSIDVFVVAPCSLVVLRCLSLPATVVVLVGRGGWGVFFSFNGFRRCGGADNGGMVSTVSGEEKEKNVHEGGTMLVVVVLVKEEEGRAGEGTAAAPPVRRQPDFLVSPDTIPTTAEEEEEEGGGA